MLLFLLLLCIISSCQGFYVTIDSNDEECFFDRLKKDTKAKLLFEVAEGGFFDIDVHIYGPDKRVIYEGIKQQSGRESFTANIDGDYKYCFSNKMSTLTPKVVLFNLELGDEPLHKKGNITESDSKLIDMINTLSESIISTKHEMDYMDLRAKLHHTVSETTNQRVVHWAAFEASLLIAMSIGQVIYIKRFFEVRRLV